MTALADLLERVKGASGPDREIDRAVYNIAVPRDEQRIIAPLYTASLDAVVALVERKLPGWDWIIGKTNGGLTIHAQLGPESLGYICFGETPALALLAALLSALEPSHVP